jgi:hypothetical protein
MRDACLLLVTLVCFRLVGAGAEEKSELPSSTGNTVVRYCSVWADETRNANASIGAVCAMYVRGLDDGIATERAWLQHQGHENVPGPYCAVGKIENGQMVRILMKYIRDNPARAHLDSSVLFSLAMAEAYPCS